MIDRRFMIASNSRNVSSLTNLQCVAGCALYLSLAERHECDPNPRNDYVPSRSCAGNKAIVRLFQDLQDRGQLVLMEPTNRRQRADASASLLARIPNNF